MKTVLTWVAVGFAALGTFLWIKASIVRLEYKPVVDEHGMFGLTMTRREGSRDIDILATAERQTWWNMWAAAATGFSVLFQALLLVSS